jgi:hypothetical protein
MDTLTIMMDEEKQTSTALEVFNRVLKNKRPEQPIFSQNDTQDEEGIVENENNEEEEERIQEESEKQQQPPSTISSPQSEPISSGTTSNINIGEKSFDLYFQFSQFERIIKNGFEEMESSKLEAKILLEEKEIQLRKFGESLLEVKKFFLFFKY